MLIKRALAPWNARRCVITPSTPSPSSVDGCRWRREVEKIWAGRTDRNYSGLSDQLLIVLYFPMECLINGRENAEHRRTFHRRSVMRLAESNQKAERAFSVRRLLSKHGHWKPLCKLFLFLSLGLRNFLWSFGRGGNVKNERFCGVSTINLWSNHRFEKEEGLVKIIHWILIKYVPIWRLCFVK